VLELRIYIPRSTTGSFRTCIRKLANIIKEHFVFSS